MYFASYFSFPPTGTLQGTTLGTRGNGQAPNQTGTEMERKASSTKHTAAQHILEVDPEFSLMGLFTVMSGFILWGITSKTLKKIFK